MKLSSTIVLLLFSFFSFGQVIDFPDPSFKDLLIILGVDKNNNGEIEISEAESTEEISSGIIYVFDFSGLEYFINLKKLSLSNDMYSTLTLPALPFLEHVDVTYNGVLDNLDVGLASNLKILNVDYCGNLEIIDLIGLEELEDVDIRHNNKLRVIDLFSSNLQSLRLENNSELRNIDLADLKNLENLFVDGNSLRSLYVSNSAILKDVYIGQGQNVQLDRLDFSNNPLLTNLEIRSEGTDEVILSSHPEMVELIVRANVSELNLSELPLLEYLDISGNYLDQVNLTNMPNLNYLSCSYNRLNELNLSGLPELQTLFCRGNFIESLNIENLSKLKSIDLIDSRELKHLTLNNLGSLETVLCERSGIKTFDLSGPNKLDFLDLNFNSLEFLDLRDAKELKFLYLEDNQLKSVFLKSGNDILDLDLWENGDLQYVCVDNSERRRVESHLRGIGYNDVVVNSYCTFTPGEIFHTLSGSTNYSQSVANCENSTDLFRNLKYEIQSERGTEYLITDKEGGYRLPLIYGDYSISPVFDGSMFSSTPETFDISIPIDRDSSIQDFCIYPTEIRNDWEVAIIPVDRARPGFESQYKLIVNNNGNTNLSGSVSVFYDSSIMGVVNADDFPREVDGTLSWDFGNGELLDELGPFESKEINFTMILNRPTDNPSLNNGDIVSLVAEIGFDKVDETPENNRFKLKQVIVNSFDPNDKTCLEGNSILPEMIGEYLHYLIRFENKGSAEAVNIVVRDVIDTTKFDISSVEITDASHNQYTRIENGVIEFIFEGINLPFEDAVNDGYVAFKIRTKDELITGDKVENDAEIYFDFNSPIITNTAESIFEIISPTQEVAEGLDINIFPNPTFGELNIVTESRIQKVELYRTDGKLIGLLNSNDVISLKGIPDGIYVLSISTDEGKYVEKIVKH